MECVISVTVHFAAEQLAFSLQHSASAKGLIHVKDFRDLIVWQKAHSLTLCAYRVTDSFPKAETLWINHSDTQVLSFNCGKHCGGLREARERRIPALLEYRLRVGERIGVSLSACSGFSFLERVELQEAARWRGRSEAHACIVRSQSRDGASRRLNTEC